jgi:hypothetical protein
MLDMYLQQKLRDPMAEEGLLDPLDLMEVDPFGRATSYSICTNKGCNFTLRIPIDEQDAVCEVCDTWSMMNAVHAANCGWTP